MSCVTTLPPLHRDHVAPTSITECEVSEQADASVTTHDADIGLRSPEWQARCQADWCSCRTFPPLNMEIKSGFLDGTVVS
jgi:hypothetical protein